MILGPLAHFFLSGNWPAGRPRQHLRPWRRKSALIKALPRENYPATSLFRPGAIPPTRNRCATQHQIRTITNKPGDYCLMFPHLLGYHPLSLKSHPGILAAAWPPKTCCRLLPPPTSSVRGNSRCPPEKRRHFGPFCHLSQ